MKYLLSTKIAQDDASNIIQNLLSLLTPIAFVIFNSSHTFQTDIIQTQSEKILPFFDFLLYLTPDRAALHFGKINYLSILFFILIISPMPPLLLQFLSLSRTKRTNKFMTHTFNITLAIAFKLLTIPIVSTLTQYISNTFFSSEIPQYSQAYMGKLSLFFLLIYLIETAAYILFFTDSGYKTKKLGFFASLDSTGLMAFTLNNWLISITTVLLSSHYIWSNTIKLTTHSLCALLFIIRHPFYSYRANMCFAIAFSINALSSFSFLAACMINSQSIIVLVFILVNPCAAYLACSGLAWTHIKLMRMPAEDINEYWQMRVSMVRYVEKLENLDKDIAQADKDIYVQRVCNEFDEFFEKSEAKTPETRFRLKSWFYLVAERPEVVYYEIFFYSFAVKGVLERLLMMKTEMILKDFIVLERFYSNYVLMHLKSKKNDLGVCNNLLSLSSELQENYPNLKKIYEKTKLVVFFLKKTLKCYSKLMKDYQNSETLELYGSFLCFLSYDKGQRYINLAKTMNFDIIDADSVCWLLDPSSGFAILSLSRLERGLILEKNKNFLNILCVNKETFYENVLSLLSSPFQDIAEEVLSSKTQQPSNLRLIEDCFRFIADEEGFIIDIDVKLLPITWKKKVCMLIACRKIKGVSILLDSSFRILNISQNFLDNILGYRNKSNISLVLNKPITNFLPRFLERYSENSTFDYYDNKHSEKMSIFTKNIRYKDYSYVYLSISSLNSSFIRQNTMLKSLKRKHSLTVVQFSDIHDELYDSSRIVENKHTAKHEKPQNLDLQSKNIDYEAESITIAANSFKKNSDVLMGFEIRVKFIKIVLGFIFLISVVSVVTTLTFAYFYIGSYDEFKNVEKVSKISDCILNITLDARSLHLVENGWILVENREYYRKAIANSTENLKKLIEVVNQSPSDVMKNDKSIFSETVKVVRIDGVEVITEDMFVIDAYRQILSKATKLSISNEFDYPSFLFIYVNSVGNLLEKSISCIKATVSKFSKEKSMMRIEIILIIVLTQLAITGVFLACFWPLIVSAEKFYRKMLKEVFSVKKEVLKEISNLLVRRLRVYHYEKIELKETFRRRRPRLKKQWISKFLIMSSIIGIYIVLYSLLLAEPIGSLNASLKEYTSDSILLLSIYLQNSYFWTRENFLSSDIRVSFSTLQGSYLNNPSMKESVFRSNENISNILKEINEKIRDANIREFLFQSLCSDQGFCDDYFHNGMFGAINEVVRDFEHSLNQISPQVPDVFNDQRLMNVMDSIAVFLQLCESYAKKKLNHSDFITSSVILCVGLLTALCIFYKKSLKRSFKDILLYAKVRILFASESIKPKAPVPSTNHLTFNTK